MATDTALLNDDNYTAMTEEWKKIGDYSSAEKTKELSLMERMQILLYLIIDTLKAFIVVIPSWFRFVLEVFIPPEPKVIEGEVALVTGGGNGLGRALALELSKRGAKVAICDLDEAAGEETVKLIKQAKGPEYEARSYKADVADPVNMSDLRDKITKDFGEPVSILVNNAGLMPSISILNGADEDYKKIVDVNLLSHFWCIRAFVPSMKQKNHGHVVIISSMAGFHGVAGTGVYSATKFALRGLAESLSAELENGSEKVLVTCVHPYFISTRENMIKNVKIRIPPMSATHAAFKIIEGMRRNYRSMSLPSYMMYTSAFVNLLPYDVANTVKKVFQVKIRNQR